MKKHLLFALLLLISVLGFAQQPKKLKLSEMKFDFIMGHKIVDTTHVWCILGMDFVTPHASDNARNMLVTWMAKHKNADVIPVCAFGPPKNVAASPRLFIFCWIVDKKDTLNNYLVKNGCFPGGIMFAYDQWEIRNKTAPKNTTLPEIYIYVAKKSYEDYKGQIIMNERFAHDNKLGLWSDKEYHKIKDIQEPKK